MDTRIEAPWSDLTVERLNAYQGQTNTHPFTCRNRNDGNHVETRPQTDLGQLVATNAGWVCLDCDYTQNWAHSGMVALTDEERDEGAAAFLVAHHTADWYVGDASDDEWEHAYRTVDRAAGLGLLEDETGN